MLVLKLEIMINGTKIIGRKNMKTLSILLVLSNICIHNSNSVLVLCSLIVEPNTES